MKKLVTKVFLLILLLFRCLPSYSQLAASIPHSFTVVPGTPPVFPATMTNIMIDAQNQNEWDTLISPLNFTFNFAGVDYSKFVVSTNGWIALMPGTIGSVPSTISPFAVNALSNNTTGYPIIAPMWDDLATSFVSYSVPVSNSLWIRWSVKWDNTNPTINTLWYIKLNGNDNSISFYYPNDSNASIVNPSASIGIAGIITGDFYSVNCTGNQTAYVDSATENTNIGMGTSPNARPYNVSYIFTPLIPTGIEQAEAEQTTIKTLFADANTLQVSVHSKSNSTCIVEMLDLTGKILRVEKLILSGHDGSFVMDVSDLNAGMYVVRTKVDGKNAAVRVFKI